MTIKVHNVGQCVYNATCFNSGKKRYTPNKCLVSGVEKRGLLICFECLDPPVNKCLKCC